MKRMLWAAAVSAAIVMTGCDNNAGTDKTAVDAHPAEAMTEAAEAAGPASAASAAAPASADAPDFAVIYPGAEATGPATTAQGPAGPGGILNFTTEATPDEVVAFYRARAEAAGLTSINAMNRGDARGYAAGDTRNRLLNVVATPVEGSPTDVQLSWSSGN
ncbi:hypothetical protein [Brevundimonas sp.]|uniref:hypothetical protein n=1 Tax=Brevundimonas sp. TaxID=1871086 RepID=UPI003F713938